MHFCESGSAANANFALCLSSVIRRYRTNNIKVDELKGRRYATCSKKYELTRQTKLNNLITLTTHNGLATRNAENKAYESF